MPSQGALFWITTSRTNQTSFRDRSSRGNVQRSWKTQEYECAYCGNVAMDSYFKTRLQSQRGRPNCWVHYKTKTYFFSFPKSCASDEMMALLFSIFFIIIIILLLILERERNINIRVKHQSIASWIRPTGIKLTTF